MANAKAKLYYTQEKYLSTLPVQNGNIIFVADSHKVCLDMSKTRHTYQTIQEFKTDAERLALQSPYKGFYFVEETNTIWRYSDSWKRITNVSLNPIVYGETEEAFPQEGEKNSLYFTDDGIFNWKEAVGKYNLIANANKWDKID